MEILKDKTVTVRKDHVCIWCGDKIPKGTRAQSRAYVFEGEFMADRMHTECYAAMCTMDWNDGEFEPHSFGRGTVEQADYHEETQW